MWIACIHPTQPGDIVPNHIVCLYGQSLGLCEGLSGITYLLSMLLVSTEKIRPIIDKKIRGAVTVTRG